MPEIAEKKEDFKFKQLGIVCVQYMCLWGGEVKEFSHPGKDIISSWEPAPCWCCRYSMPGRKKKNRKKQEISHVYSFNTAPPNGV